ncbi:MAG: trypsin-like peptidase domain-containing protein, partial [Planctomycetota bacterium]|nr:trypsin-like peptidase domain-containing protein [Planctomycetota bacterium]
APGPAFVRPPISAPVAAAASPAPLPPLASYTMPAPAPSGTSPLMAAGLFGIPLLLAGALACVIVAGAILYIFHRQNQLAEAQRLADLRQAQADANIQALGEHASNTQRQWQTARSGLKALGQKTGQIDASIQAMAQRLAALEQALAEVSSQDQARAAELAQSLEKLRSEYGVRLQSLEDGQKLTADRLNALQAELTGQIEALRKDLGEAKEAWKKAGGEEVGRSLAERFGQAVFVCCMRVQRPLRLGNAELPAGKLVAFGTAWAFDPRGRLATNAHVVAAYQQLQEKGGDAFEPVAVQNGTGQVVRIVRWRIHPSYQNPSLQAATDVGILRAAQPLTVVFPVADANTLQSLGPGQAVFSIGFPIEVPSGYQNMYSYDTPDRAVATMRCGWIQRITTVDGRLGSPAERRVMHIGINAVGGQSGSPVFTRDGQVVALLNAGEIAGQIAATGQRIPHSGLFTYAVRADALAEIADAETD